MNNTISSWRNYKKNYRLNDLPKNGILLTFTQINHPPKNFRNYAPYLIGIVELEDGTKILAQITDAKLEDLKIGMSVCAVFRKFFEDGEKGTIQYGVKFKPA
jgi:uncharacterized OB-fold protein